MAESKNWEVRGLKSEEITAWLNLLGEAFAEKGVPSSFFEAHMLHDPWFDVQGVRLCIDTEANPPNIASTIRVYSRWMYIGGQQVRVGAIGDVGTSPKYQRQGLASLVMKDAIKYMKDSGCGLSVLHTSKAHLASYYKKQGYVSVPTVTAAYTLIPGALKNLTPSADSKFAVKLIDLNDKEASLESLEKIHRNKAAKLSGCFKRSSEYWTRWVRHACTSHQMQVWVAAAPLLPPSTSSTIPPTSSTSTSSPSSTSPSTPSTSSTSSTPDALTYMVARVGKGPLYQGVLQVVEFFCAEEVDKQQQAQHIFRQLLSAAVNHGSNDEPIKVIASPAMVNPEWFDSIFSPTKVKTNEPPHDATGTRSTLTIAVGQGPLNSDAWIDEGQMYMVINRSLCETTDTTSDQTNDDETFLKKMFAQNNSGYAFLGIDSF